MNRSLTNLYVARQAPVLSIMENLETMQSGCKPSPEVVVSCDRYSCRARQTGLKRVVRWKAYIPLTCASPCRHRAIFATLSSNNAGSHVKGGPTLADRRRQSDRRLRIA